MPKRLSRAAIQKKMAEDGRNEFISSGRLARDILVFGEEERKTERIKNVKKVKDMYYIFQRKMHRHPKSIEDIVKNLALHGKKKQELEEAVSKLSGMKR